MDTQILKGDILAEKLLQLVSKKIEEFKEATSTTPGLGILAIGEFEGGKSYRQAIEKLCKEIEIYLEIKILPSFISLREAIEELEIFNASPNINGILIEMPLPANFPEKDFLLHLSPQKDVDCLSLLNRGKFALDSFSVISPCTPLAVYCLLIEYGIRLKGSHLVIVGRSNIVGKPLALLMLRKGIDATVTVCHSKTPHLEQFTSQADILVVAVNSPRLITSSMIKEGAVVIDVGINKIFDSKLGKDIIVGDVDFEDVMGKASAITPVPGGVGSLTRVLLIKNTLKLAYLQRGLEDETFLLS